jgi:hypothetical protein
MGKRYPKAEALKIIKGIIATGSIIPTGHLKQRMREKNFDMQDVLCAIKNGNSIREAEPHPKTGRWIYSIEGKTIDGKKLRVEIDIGDDKDQAVILTGIKSS